MRAAAKTRAIAALAVIASGGAASAEPAISLQALAETVRVDLDDGRVFVGSRPGGPTEAEALRLPLPLSLTAVRDEVVAFQVMVSGPEGERAVRLSGFAGPGEAPPVGAVFREVAVKVTEPSASAFIHSLGAGAYPDALIETTTVAVRAPPAVTMLWIDVFVPRGAEVGTYDGTLEVGDASLPIEIQVLEPTLPEVDVARLSAANFGSFLALERAGALTRWMQLAHAHHLSVEYMRVTPAVAPDGAIDWAGWVERVGPFVDGSAFTAEAGYRGPRAGLPTTRFILPHTDWWPSKPARRGQPSDPAGWSAALGAWEQVATAEGWLSGPAPTEWVLFVNSLDEPKTAGAFADLASYGSLIAEAKLIDRTRIRFRTDGAVGQTVEGWPDRRVLAELGPVVDVWNVCGAVAWVPYELLVKRLEAHPDEQILAYASNTAGEPAMPPIVVDSPIAGARAWGWIVARYGLGGLMNWEVDARAGCVENLRCTDAGLNLDATLIYRGAELGEGWLEPIGSMRLKALRRGAQDVALLSLLPPHEAAAIAAAVVPRAMGDDQPDVGLGTWPVDPGAYQRARRAILDRLTGVEPPLPVAAIRVSPPPGGGSKVGRAMWIGGILLVLWAAWRTKRALKAGR